MAKIISIEETISQIKDGMTIMVGGFLGNGGPLKIMKALAASNVKNLTIICNDSSFIDKSQGLLIANKQVKKLITSHTGTNLAAIELMNSGEMEVEFSPQGTLIERIRAQGAGLGGVLTTTGLGTIVAEGKKIIKIQEKEYLLELPLKADIAILGASIADKSGNLVYLGTTQNVNPMMATAADVVFVEVETLFETGEIKPENVHTPNIFVDYLIVK